jgi:leader peptidase (prepilin peptidase)/N-methyltransferase
MPEALFAWVLCALWGACFGSFFNVLIYRMPRGLSILRPGSFCPQCKTPIRAWHNVPILGWLWLRGKCASCKEPISVQYPLVEALGLLLGFAAAVVANPSPFEPLMPARTVTLFWLFLSLIPVCAIDFKYQLLPDTVTIGGIVLGMAVSFLPDGMGWVSALAGMAVCGGGLWLFGEVTEKILGRETMGFGDIKLLASFGALMGIYPAFFALVLGACLALVVMMPLRLARRRPLDGRIPIGPFLSIAAPVSYLFGEHLTNLYFGLLDRVF